MGEDRGNISANNFFFFPQTTPLLLLDLALLAGLPAVEISLIVIADVGMILTGLIATFAGTEEAHWGFYVISCLFFVYVLYGLIIAGRKTAYLRTDKVGNAYTSIMFFTAALWLGKLFFQIFYFFHSFF